MSKHCSVAVRYQQNALVSDTCQKLESAVAGIYNYLSKISSLTFSRCQININRLEMYLSKTVDLMI